MPDEIFSPETLQKPFRNLAPEQGGIAVVVKPGNVSKPCGLARVVKDMTGQEFPQVED